jgi:benzoyl-CoA reductase/2-hydroxyglutaryl-CoA dehydratase subunit BcrC/BadD/HgdB
MTQDLQIPSRMQVIQDYKNDGGAIAAVFPIHYSRALFEAQGILPVEVWGPPGVDRTLADGHLQAYTCSIVRNSLAFVLSGAADVADLFVVPHCCDSLQGFGSILHDFVADDTPVFTLYIPRESRRMDIDFLARELECLGRSLRPFSTSAPNDRDLRAAIANEHTAIRLVRDLFEDRSALRLTDRSFYRLVRSREYLPSRQFIAFVQEILDTRDEPSEEPSVPLVLSGVVPEPMDLFDALNERNARVVADDFLSCGRRLYSTSNCADPWTNMSESLLFGPPDSTKGSSIESRLCHLVRLVKENLARGVVFYSVKFCEPEQFYYPALRNGLEAEGIPSLLVETEVGDPLSGQTMVRLEAFLEMLS